MRRRHRWGPCEGEHRGQAGGVGDKHEQDADDISLKYGLAVVFAASCSAHAWGCYNGRAWLTSAATQHCDLRQRSYSVAHSTAATHTNVVRQATRAQAPATMMTARASRAPVPPDERPVAWRVPASMVRRTGNEMDGQQTREDMVMGGG